ncbi:MAG: ectonucleotide pyrophosphatase/phosphodiesterase [Bacteroidota bacterium]
MKLQSLLVILFLWAAISSAQEKQCTILISFDGFRWDYLNRNLTPTIDSLAKQGVRASSLEPVYPSKTFPNHLAIATGMYADNHGIIQNDFLDDNAQRRFKISDTVEVRDARWYRGEAIWETARKNKKISASYFWPGSELNEEQRHPNYFERYEMKRPYSDRINGVLKWIGMPAAQRPDIITLYFDATDTQGHYFGPNSTQVNGAISRLDSVVAALIAGLRKMKMTDSTNIILVSDHGMAEVDLSRTIVLDDLLKGEQYQTQWSGPTVLLRSTNGRDKQIIELLRKKMDHASVYTKSEFPDYFHFSHNDLIYPVIIAADLGWQVRANALTKKDSVNIEYGNHGFDNHHMDMHGIFIASGPVFKKNYLTGMLKNIDIYPMLCKVLKIGPNSNTDGKLERIGFILR